MWRNQYIKFQCNKIESAEKRIMKSFECKNMGVFLEFIFAKKCKGKENAIYKYEIKE